jgi:hypothetical protein
MKIRYKEGYEIPEFGMINTNEKQSAQIDRLKNLFTQKKAF